MVTTEQRRLNGAKGYKQKQLNKQKQIQERKTENEKIYNIIKYISQNDDASNSNSDHLRDDR